jgi:hypothetical protein
MKLLLDAPEHLWRLIERKEYFRAAWLFLLARVVHRALIQDDAEEGSGWQLQGISVVVCALFYHYRSLANSEKGSIPFGTAPMGKRGSVQTTNISQSNSLPPRAIRFFRSTSCV